MNRMAEILKATPNFLVAQLKRYGHSLRVDWHKHALGLIFLVSIAMAGTALISKTYEHRDIGAPSSFAHLSGDGWSLQRAAVPVEQDTYGDSASSIRYLWQGWSPADSMRFYTMSQGSDLLPYDFFLVLNKPSTGKRFRSDENLNGYRYLIQKPSASNPDALPVGFVKDEYKGKDYLGFTCAACHTTQVNYHGVGMRIDGGGAMADMDTFMHELAPSVCKTLSTPALHDQFVKEVIALGHYSKQKKIDDDLGKSCQNLTLYNEMNATDVAYGNARLDAFGRIYNRVLEYILTDKELKEQVDSLTENLASVGAISADNAHAVDSYGRSKIESESGGDRADVIDALWKKLLAATDQTAAMKKIFIVPNAPVSYPFLWDIPQHDFVQWNGIAVNAGLGPVGRNTGEVIGVFGTLNFHEKDGFSLSSVISGQGFKAKHVSFESSIRVHNLRLIESQFESLQSPTWPEDILPKIDQESSRRGELLFVANCEMCHARIQRDDPKRRVVAFMGNVNEVKTDPQMAINATQSAGFSGILRNEYVAAGPGDVLINDKAPAAALLTKTTLSVVATPEDKNFLTRGYDWAYDLIAALFSNDIRPSLKQGTFTPDTPNAPYSSLAAYKGRSLNGIWATAPYLHNGSVPTLADLLLPEEQRPVTFQVGSREFDPVKVGMKSDGYVGFTFDTTKQGNHNTGHNYGTKLTPDERHDLLEYLKTL